MSTRPSSEYTPTETRAFRIQLLVAFLAVTAVAGTRPTTSYRALDLGADAFAVGLVQSAYSILPALTAVSLGRWIDRHGAGRPFTICLLIEVLGGLLSAAASDLLTLAVGQAITGFGSIGAFISGQAMIIARSRRSDWNKRYGTYAACLSLGQLVGPSLAASVQSLPALGGESERVVFLGGALLAGLCAILTALIPTGRAPTPAASEPENRFGATIRRVLSKPGMLVAMFVSISVASTIDVLAAYLPIYGTEAGLSVQFVGLLLSMRAAATITSRIGMEGLIKRIGWIRTLVFCLATSAVMLALLPTTAVPVLLIVVMLILGFTIGLVQPMTITWVANQAPRAERSTALAVRLTGNRVSLLFIPAVMGAVAGSVGVGSVFWILACALGLGAIVSRTGKLDAGSDDGARETAAAGTATAQPPADAPSVPASQGRS